MIVSSSSVSSRGDLDAHSRRQQMKTRQIHDEIERRKWPVLEMKPLSKENVRIIVAKQVEEHDEIIDDLCSHPNANNPSFLTSVLRGISNSSTPDRDTMKQYLSCENTTKLIEHILAQVEGSMLGNALSLLFVARHGLHEDELFDLLGRMVNKGEMSSLCDEDKKLLAEELCVAGVVRLDTKFGRLFTLPVNNPTLRDVVWSKYIKTTVRETEVRSLFVEYFENKDPSLRFCEEYPWQQEKNQCPHLGRTLVDLRVLDIMYNTEELKNELFTYLNRLVLSNNFDIVSNYNRALQKWTVKQNPHPTSTQISMMTVFLGDVILWFSKMASQHSEMPPFMRDNIQVNHLLPDPTGVLLSTTSTTTARQTQSAEQYFYHRWLWCNWPWIALRVASKSLKEAAAADRTSSTVSSVKKRGEEDVIALESTTREIRTATLPASLLTKLDKISSDDTQTQQKTSTTAVIPFSTNRYTQEVPRTSRIDSSAQKIRDAKKLLDALKTEKVKRESRLQMLQADHKLASVALINSRQQQEQGDCIIVELKSRYAKVKALFEKAVSIESSFNDVLAALDANDPANLRRHEELEHEIALKNQELKELRNESKENAEHIDQARKEALSIKSLIKATVEEREEIEPLLISLRQQSKEFEERRKSALVKKFDSAAFSKRVQLVGKIAKRRHDKQQLSRSSASQPSVEVLVNHPMVRLMETAGTKDIEEIVTKMHRDEEEGDFLRTHQEAVELELKDRRSRLDLLHGQMEELGLADSNSSGHGFLCLCRWTVSCNVDRTSLRLSQISRQM
eukprot:scaffold4230_cov87-Skeletonema_marinoi.AAC.1